MSTTTAKPRIIDPAIAALRKQHKANVEAFRLQAKSAIALNRIEKMLTLLNPEDTAKLRNVLKN